MKKLALGFLMVLLSQSALAGSVESIVGAMPDNKGITFMVMSNGCTQASDFEIEVSVNSDLPYIKLVREKQDYCRAVTHPVKIFLTYNEMGLNRLSPFIIANPFRMIIPYQIRD